LSADNPSAAAKPLANTKASNTKLDLTLYLT